MSIFYPRSLLALTITTLGLSGCVVPGPHGGPAFWIPGTRLSWFPGKDSGRPRVDRKLFHKVASGDGLSLETAFVVQGCENQKQLRKVKNTRLLWPGFGGRNYPTEQPTINHQQINVVYFDVTNAVEKN
jgi:hypothetical protein